MFNKIKFAQIIKNIKETYTSQEEFSKKSGIGRTYLSQYMNMKLDEPPKPKILEKLASASNGITNYNELMNICGYIEGSKQLNDYKNYELFSKMWDEYFRNRKELSLSYKENNIVHELIQPILPKIDKNFILTDDILDFLLEDASYLDDKTLKKVRDGLRFDLLHNINLAKLSDSLDKNIQEKNLNNTASNLNKLFNIPVLGKIAAGQPILAEEYLEGYLPVDPNIYGMTTPDDYFYLKVSGESMNLKVHNGDYALIHKQDTAEDGDIVVAIVNGDDEATLKKYKRISEETIALEPMSTLPMEPIYVNLKETNFKIIGKAIGQFGKF